MAGCGKMRYTKLWCRECKQEKDSELFKMKVGFRKICFDCYKKKVIEAQQKRRNFESNVSKHVDNKD
jgi:hypothetical protein